MKDLKNVKLFEQFENSQPMNIELPEGYDLVLINTSDINSLKSHYESDSVVEWSGLSFEEWADSLSQLGNIEYTEFMKEFYRGVIEWPEMGIKYVYEIHPL